MSNTAITLKGSTDLVTEFFEFSINSILYQRGIYPPEQFTRTSKYGLTMLVTNDAGLQAYIKNILQQLHHWLLHKSVQKLVVVVSDVDSTDVLERWQFNVSCDKEDKENNGSAKVMPTEKEIHKDIQAIIRQITASVTFLPLLEAACSFDLLIYTDKDIETPKEWEESDPRFVTNAADVRLRSFTTSIHQVEATVAYRNGE